MLEKTGEAVLRWGLSNAVIYNIAKTEAILFSRAGNKKAKEEMAATRLRFGEQEIKFNNKATRWLGVRWWSARLWLDKELTFAIHIRERIKKAQAAEARIKSLTRTYGLPSGLVRKIQIAALQAIAFSGAEIWWRGQKTHQDEIQKLLNKQGRDLLFWAGDHQKMCHFWAIRVRTYVHIPLHIRGLHGRKISIKSRGGYEDMEGQDSRISV